MAAKHSPRFLQIVEDASDSAKGNTSSADNLAIRCVEQLLSAE